MFLGDKVLQYREVTVAVGAQKRPLAAPRTVVIQLRVHKISRAMHRNAYFWISTHSMGLTGGDQELVFLKHILSQL